MGVKQYVDSVQWRAVYINGINTGYKISSDGFLLYKDKLVTEPYIHIGDKVFKIDNDYVVASAFVDNPYDHESVHNKTWYTDKELIRKAIDDEFNPKPFSDKIVRACELMENPEIRLPLVSEITGLSCEELYAIRMGDKHNEISRNYTFPIRNYPYDSKYSVSQIHEVCKLLSNPKYIRHSLIQQITGVNQQTIDLLKYRVEYQSISMFYEFCHKDVDRKHNALIYTPQQIRHACFMLENPVYSYSFIAEFCNMDINVLYKIRDRKLFTGISIDFNTQCRIEDPVTNRIIQLINDGMIKREIAARIQLEFNIKDKTKVLSDIEDIKNKYFNVNSSTTIR